MAPNREYVFFRLQVRDVIEAAYHDLVTLLYFLREAEIHEDLHEHASFLPDLQTIRGEVLGLLCRFKIPSPGSNIPPA